MKRMEIKATSIYTALLVLGSVNLLSCKKGEGDPFLSLHSRKARVVGEWVIDKYKEQLNTTSMVTSSTGDAENSSTTFLLDINGGSASGSTSQTFTETGSSSSNNSMNETFNGSAKATINFEKDGSFTRVVEITGRNGNGSSSTVFMGTTYTSNFTANGNLKITSSGTWNFLGNVEKDFKNKERIVLIITNETFTDDRTETSSGTMVTQNVSNTYSYANGEYQEIWQITTLKNKEMSLESETNSNKSEKWSYLFSGTSYFDNYSDTEKGSSTMTLKLD